MSDSFHYPPDLFNLLVDLIPILNKGKRDVLTFFQGAGVPQAMLADHASALARDASGVRKFEIARSVLTRLNDAGDSAMRPRREVVRRVVEFTDFAACWESDRFKAEALVARVKGIVDLKDAATRLENERSRREIGERQARSALAARERAAKEEERERVLQAFKAVILDSNPQRRGKRLEGVVNDLFRVAGLLVREAFEIRDDQTGRAIEQIDGVIELDGSLYLVEIKWWNQPLGPAETSQHLVRVFTRGDIGGIFISATGYTDGALLHHREAVTKKTVVMCRLDQVMAVVDTGGSLADELRRRVRAARIDRDPFLR